LEECAEHVLLFNAGGIGDDYLIRVHDCWGGLDRLIDPGDGLVVVVIVSRQAGTQETESEGYKNVENEGANHACQSTDLPLVLECEEISDWFSINVKGFNCLHFLFKTGI